jgi:hypothetical protein
LNEILPVEWRQFGIGQWPFLVWPLRKEISDLAGRPAELQFVNVINQLFKKSMK